MQPHNISWPELDQVVVETVAGLIQDPPEGFEGNFPSDEAGFRVIIEAVADELANYGLSPIECEARALPGARQGFAIVYRFLYGEGCVRFEAPDVNESMADWATFDAFEGPAEDVYFDGEAFVITPAHEN